MTYNDADIQHKARRIQNLFRFICRDIGLRGLLQRIVNYFRKG